MVFRANNNPARKLIALLTVWFLAAPAFGFPEQLKACGEGKVVKIIDGQHFQLDNGRNIRLAALKTPIDLPRFDDRAAWDIQAAKALQHLLAGKRVKLFCPRLKADRFDSLLAHAQLANGKWVNAVLVRAGLALVYPWDQSAAGLTALYQAEDQARRQKNGIWKTEGLLLFDASAPKTIPTGQWVIVTGSIRSVGKSGDTHFINFGGDYRTDFTITLSRAKAQEFAEDHQTDWDKLVGRRVMVRGWTNFKGGPMIELAHTSRLRLIADSP